MRRATSRRLRAERNRRLAEAADQLLQHDKVEGASRHLEWADTLGRLVHMTRESERLRWGFAIGGLAVLLVALAWSIPIPRAHCSIDLVARSVRFTSADEWEYAETLDAARIVASSMSAITLPGSLSDSLETLGGEPTAVIVRDGDFSVQRIAFSASSDVQVSGSYDEIEITVRNGGLSGEIFVQSAALVLTRPGKRTNAQLVSGTIGPPETVELDWETGSGVPASLRIRTIEPLVFSRLDVDSLDFEEESKIGEGAFDSTVLDGTIEILESGQSLALESGDRLVLKGIRTKRFTLTQTPDGLMVSFEGSATRVLAGPERFEANMKPSVLAYLYHQQPLAILWGAVAFVFGLLWRFRQFLARSR